MTSTRPSTPSSRPASPSPTCVSGPVQMTDLMTSLRGESGAQMYNAQTLAMLAGGAMRAKEWNGITFIDSDSVPTSGATGSGACTTWRPSASPRWCPTR